jgi:hypothetical protein
MRWASGRSTRGQDAFQDLTLSLKRPDSHVGLGRFATVHLEVFHAEGGLPRWLRAEIDHGSFEAMPQAADFNQIASL